MTDKQTPDASTPPTTKIEELPKSDSGVDSEDLENISGGRAKAGIPSSSDPTPGQGGYDWDF